jgi:hypothetical protein
MYRQVVLSVGAVLVSTGAFAKIPLLNATCGQGVEVHADEGGPVYIDGKEAGLKVFNKNYCEARHGNVTISITIRPDGSPDVSATWKGGRNGVCAVR